MVTKSVVAALAALTAVSASPVPQWEETDSPGIVGGVLAQAGDIPFIVSFQRNGQHFCGGSLLDSTTVLTAAHCVGQSVTGLTVRAGSLNRNSGGVTSPVSQIFVHPSYNPSTVDSDVAILKLRTPIAQSSTITYATLAAAGSDPAVGLDTTTAGWGNTLNSAESPVVLRKVSVPIVSRQVCRTQYQRIGQDVTNNMVCAGIAAGGKDSCQGDSGGPFIQSSTKTLIGVVSWGEGCALPNFSGVYARVGTLRSFIDQYL